MGRRTSPQSSRGRYVLKIGNDNFVSYMKVSTADYLGLKEATELPKGKGKATKRGVKGTKSFILVLKKADTIEGVRVRRLSFPVEGSVTLREFYSYAKKTFSKKGVGGIITPDGIQYAWDKIDRGGGGGGGVIVPITPRLPGPLRDAADKVGDFIDGVGDAANTVGGYIDAASDLITDPEGTIGGYIEDASGIKGSGKLVTTVGKYLLK